MGEDTRLTCYWKTAQARPALPVEGTRNLIHTGQSSPRTPNSTGTVYCPLRLLRSASTDKDPEKELFIGQVPKGEGLADILSSLCFKLTTFPPLLYDFNDRYCKAKLNCLKQPKACCETRTSPGGNLSRDRCLDRLGLLKSKFPRDTLKEIPFAEHQLPSTQPDNERHRIKGHLKTKRGLGSSSVAQLLQCLDVPGPGCELQHGRQRKKQGDFLTVVHRILPPATRAL